MNLFFHSDLHIFSDLNNKIRFFLSLAMFLIYTFLNCIQYYANNIYF